MGAEFDSSMSGWPAGSDTASKFDKLTAMPSDSSSIKPVVQGRRIPRFVSVVACGFCQGAGVDPKLGGRCPVCGASGRISVSPPVVTCPRCGGTGRENGDLTCLACEGIGTGQVRKHAVPCAACAQTGAAGIFYCLPCKGQGLV